MRSSINFFKKSNSPFSLHVFILVKQINQINNKLVENNFSNKQHFLEEKNCYLFKKSFPNKQQLIKKKLRIQEAVSGFESMTNRSPRHNLTVVPQLALNKEKYYFKKFNLQMHLIFNIKAKIHFMSLQLSVFFIFVPTKKKSFQSL